MASPTSDKLQKTVFMKTYFDDHSSAATARYIGWKEMGEHFLAQCTFGAGTGVLTFKIFAATDSSGSGATVVKAHSAPTAADASGDELLLEVSAEECLGALARATHVSVQMDNDADSDENAVGYLITGLRHTTSSALTTATVA